MHMVRQARAFKTRSEIPADYVLTPGGFRHKSRVHRGEKGHAFVRRDGSLRSLNLLSGAETDVPAEAAAAEIAGNVNGSWVTYAEWRNETGSPISRFATTWVVPKAPNTQSGQTIFIFNSLLGDGRDEIVQPVLQWGAAAPGGGDFWSVTSWHVDPTGAAFFSPSLVPVQEGDVLTGIITLTDQSEGFFSYQCEFQGIDGTALQVPGISELTWATETLECHLITQCFDYPGSPMTQMTAIDLRAAGSPNPLSWTVANLVTDCGQRTAIVNAANPGGEIDINY